MLEIKSFYKEYEDMFEEYLDDVKRILRKKNQQYIKLQEKYNKILDENENLVWVLEGQTEGTNLLRYAINRRKRNILFRW